MNLLCKFVILPRRRGDGAAVDVEVAVDVAVHGEVLAGHGGGRGGEGRGQIGVAQDLEDAVGQRPRGDLGQEARAELAEELPVVAEIGRDDRPAGGEVDGDLALDRVVLAAGEARVDQDVGATRQGDDLIGGLAGQDDQPIAVGSELGLR